MTTFLLVRHAAHGLRGDVLAGRRPSVHLSAEGRQEAEQLAGHLAGLHIAAIYSSPLERALETATPLAHLMGIVPHVDAAVNEIDFGTWAGLTFDTLASDPLWDYWNRFRSGTRAPQGESMLEAQARIVAALDRMRAEHPDAIVAVVSHGDLIKAALTYFLGMPLDFLLRLEIDPASVSMLALHDWGPRVLCVNERGMLRP